MKKINKFKFFSSILLIILLLALVIFNLDFVKGKIDEIYVVLSKKFSWLFIIANIAALIFSFWIILGPYKNIKLGGDSAKPEYSSFAWIAMMFTTSCSAGLIVFGFIESVIYASAPPFQIEPLSAQAYEYAQMYSHFHWGINAWALYVPISIAIGYGLYNNKKKKVTISTACEPIMEKFSKKIGESFDIIGIFGSVVAPVTSMGVGMPLLTLLIQKIFNISDNYITTIQIVVLVIWVIIFGTSVFLGLKKGIKNLSNFNVIVAFAFMIFIGFLTGIFDVLKAEINTIGLYLSNLVRMTTYTDPYSNSLFVENWTVWYWAWIIVYMPLMGAFNAKISKGRKLKDIVIGQMFCCSLGCWVAMSTLGNYAIKLQQSGMDIAKIINDKGQSSAIVEIIKTMPYSNIIMIIVAILCFVFMATTVDSSSFVAAESTMIYKDENDSAPRWLRIVWAIVICIITFVLLNTGSFNAVQVLAILTGFPLAIVLILIIISTIKELRKSKIKNKN